MKQGNPTKRFGMIALIGAILSGNQSMPKGTDRGSLLQRRNTLLTNGGAAPIPHKMLNQRQRRKLYRQTHCS